MSIQERRAIVSIISVVLITAIYVLLVMPGYPVGDPYSPEVFQFWGTFFVLMVVFSIGVRIVIEIVFTILQTLAERNVDPAMADERDKLIELKSFRNALYAISIGFLLAMIPLALGQVPSITFILLISAGVMSELVEQVSSLYFHRRGF